MYYNGRDSGAHDSITIVSSHKILACTKKDPGLELQVNYKVLGELAGNATKKQLDLALLSNAKDTTESFYMVKDGKSWKIDSASIHQPHVGKSAAKNLIK